MKKVLLVIAAMIFSVYVLAQVSGFPSVNLRNTTGKWVSSKNIDSEGKPLMMVFWNFDSKESGKQVQALSVAGNEMLGEDNVKMVGIFVDNNGNWQSEAAQILGKDFGMEIYIDINGEFMRTLSVPGLPYTQVYNPEMKLICSYFGYCSGAEELVCKKSKRMPRST